MEIVTIVIIASLLLMLFLVIQAGIKFLAIKKELAEANTKVIVEKKFVKVSYENDLKVLLETIDEYSNNMSFTELKEYHDSRNIINDKVFNDLARKITIEIHSALSEEYLELIEQYVSDSQLFIYEKVYYKVLSIVMDINKKNVIGLSKN